ncbi:MAG: alcohol dehydrogenase [Planctomycetota bacterium]|nr:MAG: alcohol dehydrogenase [Planctomycetota bacterium]REJ89825.1 MAG: alcohol dehydrogenase [Planctomycetota bacterium]
MQALRLLEIGQPLAAAETAVPTPGDGEVLVHIAAAGICHSDAHYRRGDSPTGSLPLTLGHEVAGRVAELGKGVTSLEPGARVALDYLVTCGSCEFCARGARQFCPQGKMIGKHRDGGFAEFIVVPAENAIAVPDAVPLDAAALMMCSSSTSLHALERARLAQGESVAVFGAGGLGMSAIQLARILGAGPVFAIDIDAERLQTAEQLGAVPIDATRCDPLDVLMHHTDSRGVDVALELIGLAHTMQQAVQVLAVHGRAALVGITPAAFPVQPYDELLNKEAEILGVSDHLASDLPRLLDWAATGELDFSPVIRQRIPLVADAANAALDRLQSHGSGLRTVIVQDTEEV